MYVILSGYVIYIYTNLNMGDTYNERFKKPHISYFKIVTSIFHLKSHTIH